MPDDKPNSPVEVFVREARSDGFDVDAIPPSFAKVGDFFGKSNDGAADEADEKLTRVTAENVAKLCGREVAADGLSVTLRVMGKETKADVDRLRFTRGTAHWPAQIRDQVPQIERMVQLRQRLREVQKNPKLKRQLVVWLRANPAAKQLLDRILDAYDR